MANVFVNETYLSDIADAIREKLDTEATYKPSQMADAIESIETGGITPTGEIEITANGTYDVTNYSSAEVDVPQSGITPTGTISITQNGTTDVTNYASALVNVPSSGGTEVTVATACTNANACVQEIVPSTVSGHIYMGCIKNKSMSNYVTDQLIAFLFVGNNYGIGCGIRYRGGQPTHFAPTGTAYDAKVEVGDVYVVYDIELS